MILFITTQNIFHTHLRCLQNHPLNTICMSSTLLCGQMGTHAIIQSGYQLQFLVSYPKIGLCVLPVHLCVCVSPPSTEPICVKPGLNNIFH
jgi:hypothetical protein